MGFISDVKLPTGNTNSTGSGGFLDSTYVPSESQSNKIGQFQNEANQSAQESQQANGFGNIVKNTATGVLGSIYNFGKNTAQGTWQIYQQTPQKIVDDIKESAKTMQTGGTSDQQSTGFLKGIFKAGFRTAADAANAVFAPLSAAIGSALQTTGGSKLIDDAGKVIADHNGITDWPAFQQFAISHPNAGEDFNRLTTLVMSAGEKGKIEPTRILSDIKGLTDKVIETASKTESPITNQPVLQRVAPEAPTRPVVESITQPQQILPPREAGVTKTASDINQNLVKQGFDALPPEDQAKYTPQSYKDIATRVASMLDTNPEDVKSMAKGDTPIPKDINPEILFNAVEAKAIKEGDTQTLIDLAKSPVSQTSQAGQTLGGHGYNDNPNSPVNVIKDIQTAREKTFSKNAGQDVVKAKSATVDEIASEIKKTAPTRQSWSDFVEQIRCNY